MAPKSGAGARDPRGIPDMRPRGALRRCLCRQARIDQLDEVVLVDNEPAPSGIEGGGRLGGNDRVERLTLALERNDVVAYTDEHVAERDQVGACTDRTVARDDDGPVGGTVDGFVRPGDGIVDVAAILVVDERKMAVPERIAEGQYVGLDEVHPQVAVGVTCSQMLNLDAGTV